MSDEPSIYICALRGGLSGLEGGSYFEEITAYNPEAAAIIFCNKHRQWPTDIGLRGSNLDYTHRLERRVAELEAQLAIPQAIYTTLWLALGIADDEVGKNANSDKARAWLVERKGVTSG
jgi:hypothetical protein